MAQSFHLRYAAFLANALIIASVEYATVDQQSNPFNDLFGRHEVRDYWDICKVVDGFIELLKYDFDEVKRAYMVELLDSAFMALYGKTYDPLETIGASIESRPVSYSVRSQECIRIAQHILSM